jgi:adenylylsulfate kinase-like enzyme
MILRRIAEIDKYLADSGMDYLVAFVVKFISEADRGQ